MLILLALTFAGTLYQVRLSSSMGSEAAIESFVGAAYVLIPLGGENSLIFSLALSVIFMEPGAEVSALGGVGFGVEMCIRDSPGADAQMVLLHHRCRVAVAFWLCFRQIPCLLYTSFPV